MWNLDFRILKKEYLQEKRKVKSDLETSNDVVTECSNGNTLIELICMFNTAYFLAKKELLFREYHQLCKLQCKNTELRKYYFIDAACKRFISSIGKALKKNSKELINNSRSLSVLPDGSTDSCVIEHEIVYVQDLQDRLPKPDMAGIKLPDQVDDKRLLAATEIANEVKTAKQFDDDT